LHREELETILSQIEQKFKDSGANFVIRGIWDLFKVIESINERLSQGLVPNDSAT